MSLATRNFLMSLGGSLAGAASSIIISMALSRALGPEGRGILTQIILWPPIIANIIHAGWAIGITSRVSTNPEQLVGISSSATKLGSMLSIIGMVVSYIVISSYGSNVSQSSAALIFLLYIPLATYECVNRALLEGSHKFKETSVVRGVFSILNALIISLAWLFDVLSIEIYIVIYLSTLALSSFVQLYILRQNTQRSYVDLLIKKGNNDWLRTAIKAIPYVIVTIIVTRLDLIVLTRQFQSNAHELGLYVAASSIGSGITLIAQSVVYALIPRVSQNGESYNPKRSSRNLSVGMVIFSIIIALLILPYGEFLMKILFGDEFANAGGYIFPSIVYTTIGGLISIRLSQDAAEGEWRRASFTFCLLAILCPFMLYTVNISTVSGYVYLMSVILAIIYFILNTRIPNDN